MKKRTTIMLLVGFGCIVIGGMLALGGYMAGGMTSVYVTRNGIEVPKERAMRSYSKTLDSFSSIDVTAARTKVEIKEGDSYAVEYEPSTSTHFGSNAQFGDKNVKVQNGTLVVDYQTFTYGIDGFLIGNDLRWEDDTLTITVPKGTKLDSVKSGKMSGSLAVSVPAVKDMDLQSDYGSVTVAGTSMDKLTVKSDAGAIKLGDVHVAGPAAIDADYGKISIDASSLGSLSVVGDSGSIDVRYTTIANGAKLSSSYGSVLFNHVTCKGLDVEADSGRINLDGDLTGAINIESSYGSVSVDLARKEPEYALDLATDYGAVTVGGRKSGTTFVSSGTPNSLRVRADSGSIRVDFTGEGNTAPASTEATPGV